MTNLVTIRLLFSGLPINQDQPPSSPGGGADASEELNSYIMVI